MALEDRILELEKAVAEIQGRMDLERHDHERLLILTQELGEAQGAIDRISDQLGELIRRLSSLGYMLDRQPRTGAWPPRVDRT